jgi:hypothetical protein
VSQQSRKNLRFPSRLNSGRSKVKKTNSTLAVKKTDTNKSCRTKVAITTSSIHPSHTPIFSCLQPSRKTQKTNSLSRAWLGLFRIAWKMIRLGKGRGRIWARIIIVGSRVSYKVSSRCRIRRISWNSSHHNCSLPKVFRSRKPNFCLRIARAPKKAVPGKWSNWRENHKSREFSFCEKPKPEAPPLPSHKKQGKAIYVRGASPNQYWPQISKTSNGGWLRVWTEQPTITK